MASHSTPIRKRCKRYNIPGHFHYLTFADFLILQNNYNKTLTNAVLTPSAAASVPEPTSLILLLIPLTLTKRRRPTTVPQPN